MSAGRSVVAGGFVPGDIGYFYSGCCTPSVWVHGMFCWGCCWFCISSSQSSSMFLQIGQFGPHPHFSICFWVMVAQGIAALWGCGSTFIVGVEVGVGGNWPVFFWLKFPDADPAVGHGVPALVWISSSGGGFPAEESPWSGFPWNFPFAKFIMVMGMVSGVCMVMLFA